MRSDSDEFNRPDNPRKGASFLSIITFWYALKTFMVGRKRDLDEYDLTEPLEEHTSSSLGDTLARNWTAEIQDAAKNRRPPNFGKAIMKTFRWNLVLYGILLFVMEMGIRMQQPIYVGLFIRYFNPKNMRSSEPQHPPTFLMRAIYYFSKDQSRISKSEAFFFAACIVICSFVSMGIFHPCIMAALHVGMQIRVACCSLIYRKALRIKLTALGGDTVGNIINLMSSDVSRFNVAPLFLHYLWLAPLQCCLITFLIYLEIGVAAVYGMTAVLMISPLQVLMSLGASYLRVRAGARTDARVRHMNEVIQAIQVIKMYAWENAFIGVINRLRKEELKVLMLTSYIRGITMSFIMITARAGIFLTVLSYVLLGNDINAERVFVIAGYYLVIRTTCAVYFPLGLNAIAETKVSIRRIQEFMMTVEVDVGDRSILDPNLEIGTLPGERSRPASILKKERDLQNTTDSLTAADTHRGPEAAGAVLEQESSAKIANGAHISIFHGSAKYGESLCLENINTRMTKGQLIAIVGTVGSGKTCLLNLILGELEPFTGKLVISGVVSYASQEPWLFAGTVRQNILFGKPFNPERYHQTIRACALKRDFSLLPYGDRTMVGERGTSLSGGQRARINLARAVYKEADIYLFDDPLSAVDIQVGRQLFEECMLRHLKHKIVVLVTHQLQYLRRADKIIVLNEGTIAMQGTYEEMKKSEESFALLFEEAATLATSLPEEEKETEKMLKAISHTSIAFNSIVDIEGLKPGRRATPEMRSSGAVAFGNYKEYFLAGGNHCQICLMLLLFLGSQTLASFADFFLSLWVNLEERRGSSDRSKGLWNHLDRGACIKIYAIITAGTIAIVVFRSVHFFSICIRASYRLHSRMLRSVVLAAMNFFHQNTSGRILNRFSKDLSQVDELLPEAFIDTLQIIFNLIGAICVVCMVNAWFLIPVVIMLGIFYYLRRFYLKTSRSVKRLEGISRSPVFAHLNATLRGLSTIRINKAEKTLVKEFDRLQDIHSSAWFMFLYTSRAFSLWLDWITVLFIGCVSFICVFASQRFYGGTVGLVITQALGLTGLIQWGMRQSAELENQMTSVERVLEFARIEHEQDVDSAPDRKPPPSWPGKGHIEFVDTSMRYDLSHEPVLKDLNIVILPEQKIGIVGRSGAGKSSLILTLFRLCRYEGEVYVDHLDISVLGLHDLRRKISIIPQEPILFNGSLRYNLDPLNEYDDDQMLAALTDVEDRDACTRGKACLDKVMTEGGQNISAGQRQMICLARAILRNNKILVMDEATANLDARTDKLIQKTIRSKFANCTVLTIAHRLHTVMDSDKILVMDAGRCVEFDHPYVLLQNPEGYLSALVRRTGTAIAAFLTETARQKFYPPHDDLQPTFQH
ncbi:ATP-binding cassette sub-family C member 4-like isoform X2 [Euwallacea fornicatus]|uniref:ATP-binding cassette sub-family C member 4-like isoform X2 n=1 Tax=Euwallacea fornicatus TaxID=995702 RepID=UPI00338F1F7D